MLKCFIGLFPDGILSDYRRVWLWLDEIENLLGYDERERWETVKALENPLRRSPPLPDGMAQRHARQGSDLGGDTESPGERAGRDG